MNKILISACFVGENVKYNGGHQHLQHSSLIHSTIQKWLKENRLVSVCPECSGGLLVPRDPAEINQSKGNVTTINGEDVTENYRRGALHVLAICNKNNIRFALLKESSPSCGSHFIYDGSFSKTKRIGQGITAKLLMDNNIAVFSENNLQALIDIINN